MTEPTARKPSRKRQALWGLASSLVAPIGPALVALLPLDAPLQDTRVAIAWGVTVVALCVAAFALTRAVGADRASAAFLLVVVYAAPIAVGAAKVFELAWTAQVQAVLERRWEASLGDGSIETLELAVSAERALISGLASDRIVIRPRVHGHEHVLDELRAYERGRSSPDPADWKEHEKQAGLAVERLERHGGHDEELALIRFRDAELRARLTALRVAGAERIAARVGAPGVDPAGARFLGAVVRGEVYEGAYRSAPGADRVAVVLGDDLHVEGGRAASEHARDLAMAELAAIASRCLEQPALFSRAPDAYSGYEFPPALLIELTLHRRPSGEAAGSSPEGEERAVPRSGTLDPRAVEVEARVLPATTTAIDVRVRARARSGFWSFPEWEHDTLLHVEAATGTPIVEAAYLAAVRHVAAAMGLDPAVGGPEPGGR